MAQKKVKNNGVRTFFKGLISNDAVISGSKASKWWVGLIIALVSSFIPVVPIMVNTAKSTGSQFLNGATNGFDQYLTEATMNLGTKGYEFKIDDSNHLLAYRDSTLIETADNQNLYEYVSTRRATKIEDETPVEYVAQQIEFQLFYSTNPANSKDKEENTVNKLIEYLESDENRYYVGTTTKYVEPEVVGEDYVMPSLYKPSYMVLYKEGLYVCVKAFDDVKGTAAMNYAADWKHTEKNINLLTTLLTVFNADKEQIIPDSSDSAYVAGVYKNWKNVFNESYITARKSSLKFSTLIYTGIYIVLIFIMGLMLFLLTRGKRNMFNYLTFLDTQKMAWWASFSPALLALILGFIFSGFAMMLYIVLLGLRTMWMSMRQLRPQY